MKSESLPLAGKTVLVTRARKQASELVTKIAELGGSVIEFPVIEIVPPTDPMPMDQAIGNMSSFDWIIFTSVNGVEFFFRRLRELDRNVKDLAKIAVVGPKTAEIVRKWGREPDLTAADYLAEGLIEVLSKELSIGDRILFPRSRIARPVLVAELKNKGFIVTDIEAYSTIAAVDKSIDIGSLLQNRMIDMITFTSSSTVSNFCETLPSHTFEDLLSGVKVVCIGPITASTAANYHLRVSAVANEYTIPGLLQALVELATVT